MPSWKTFAGKKSIWPNLYTRKIILEVHQILVYLPLFFFSSTHHYLAAASIIFSQLSEIPVFGNERSLEYQKRKNFVRGFYTAACQQITIYNLYGLMKIQKKNGMLGVNFYSFLFGCFCWK